MQFYKIFHKMKFYVIYLENLPNEIMPVETARNVKKKMLNCNFSWYIF